MKLATFAGFVDDAALFPPGNAPMATAVPAHRGHRSAWYADLVGPFLCPDRKLTELTQVNGSESLELNLIVPGGAADVAGAVLVVRGSRGLRLTGIEVKADASGVAGAIAALRASLPPAALGYVEVPRGPDLERSLDALAAAGYRPKFRTGGVAASAFPSEAELAAFIVACAERELPFKLTAGLHHAIRHTSDFEYHGFVNVLAAVLAAGAGAGAGLVAARLAERDAGALLSETSEQDVVSARGAFVSFGTCSVTEPLDDLLALGLIAKT